MKHSKQHIEIHQLETSMNRIGRAIQFAAAFTIGGCIGFLIAHF